MKKTAPLKLWFGLLSLATVLWLATQIQIMEGYSYERSSKFWYSWIEARITSVMAEREFYSTDEIYATLSEEGPVRKREVEGVLGRLLTEGKLSFSLGRGWSLREQQLVVWDPIQGVEMLEKVIDEFCEDSGEARQMFKKEKDPR